MTGIEVRQIAPADPADFAAWEAYARAKDSSLGYFSLAWGEIFSRVFGHPFYPLAALRAGKISGILPLTLVASRLFGRFLVSMPFVNYGGVLADDPVCAGALLAGAQRLKRQCRAKSAELRHAGAPRCGLPERSAKVSMLLDLPGDPDLLWKGLKDKVRNQVRKARKNGLSALAGREELLPDFYRVFCVNMRDLGTPVYGRDFFAEVLRAFPETTRILSVQKDGRCIAAGITYAYGDTLQMPWASSLPSFRRHCPNNLLYWTALSEAAAGGFARFDFGRSTPGTGPWSFKRQWGAREVPLHWEYLLEEGADPPALNVQNPSFRLAIAVWRRLPLGVANALGPRIVRCIP